MPPLSLRTPLNSLLPALRHPIILAPMANASGGLLASRVSHAGGFGFIGAGYYTPSKLHEELQHVFEVLGVPGRGSANRLEVGVGFLAWRLSKLNGGPAPSLGASDLDPASEALQLIDTALKAKPRAVWLAFGNPEELVGWSKVVREREAALHGGGRAKWGKELKLFVGVGNTKEAKWATEEMGADVLVVQGIESGGHSLGTSPPLSSLLPLINSLLPSWSPSSPSNNPPLLLGAGGLHSGSTLLSTLSLGAAGAVFGTRFLFTHEAAYSKEQKGMLVAAKEGTTVRTRAFDEARGTLGWPEGVDGRGILNETVKDFDEGKGSVEERKERYKEAEAKGDTSRIVTWAGSGVGNINEVTGAEEVVQRIATEVAEAAERLRGYMTSEEETGAGQ
ncbi:2-nitropropane dioxygenase [Microstroma glucosiphilum]|uniref:2-nitropropane dioxygenase n=1 Tax=Pseudomicrostroma glucosiphilum TaxID=1684307 RepID=A0A316U1U2_9BASI|nr:2-nitropropane dioxygenase [Pseudomicrostroma glucosiphilum]PWN18403.1 2-nitropropane dioxygenase [Pseudomicrostroma glucosiphilum]